MNPVLKDSKVLVTGGAGFIGSNLIAELLAGNNKIVCLDNFSAGHKENIAEFLSHENFSLIEGDICDKGVCLKACENVEYVFHQAAMGSVPRSIADPIATNQNNVTGFLNMLWAAKENKVKRFVYASSSSVYGDDPDLPKVESKIGKPLSPYAVTKSINEQYAEVFFRCYGLKSVGLRYFNVFGPKQDPNGAYAAVIPKFILSLLNGEAPTINGDGSYSRDFTYVSNVVLANQLAALSTSEEGTKAYNVAAGGRVDLNELFVAIRDAVGEHMPEVKKLEAIHGDARQGDIPHSLANISLAKKELGYEVRETFESGLGKCVDWYWNNYKK